MALTPIDYPPGIFRDETQHRARGKWWNCDKVRFRNGRPEQIGGNTKVLASPMDGAVRLLQRLIPRPQPVTGQNQQFVMVGTSTKVYKYDTSTSTATNITPAAFTFTAGTNAMFDGTGWGGDATSYVQITDSGTHYWLGAKVTISGATAGATGIPLANINTTFTVVAIYPSLNGGAFITLSPTTPYTYPKSGLFFGGAAISVSVALGPQLTSNGSYDSVTGAECCRLWSGSVFGNDYVFCDRNGPIVYYYSDQSAALFLAASGTTYGSSVTSGGVAFTANNVPISATGVAVGKDRSVIAFGAVPYNHGADSGYVTSQDRLHVRWSSQENAYDWEPRADNTAGGYTLPWGTYIMGWCQTKLETLIWTDTALVSMKWIGAPYYYGFERIASNVSLIAPNAVANFGDVVYWMGEDQFYYYDGAVHALPCTCLRYVYSNVNRAQKYKIAAGINPGYNEVWWWYTSAGRSTENDYYVVFNPVERCWYIGSGGYSAAILSDATTPYAADSSGYVYSLDSSYADNTGSNTNAVIASSLTSGAIEIGNSDQYVFARRLLPDFQLDGDSTAVLTHSVQSRNFPTESFTTAVTTNATINPVVKQIACRVRGRELALAFTASTNASKWIMGQPMFDIQGDGGTGA